MSFGFPFETAFILIQMSQLLGKYRDVFGNICEFE
jgi:hypothetical protein